MILGPTLIGFLGGASGKKNNLPANAEDKRCQFNPWVGKMSWRRKRQPTLVCLPGKSHRQRSLAGYSPWGHKRVRYNLAKTYLTLNTCTDRRYYMNFLFYLHNRPGKQVLLFHPLVIDEEIKVKRRKEICLLLLLLSRFSRVRLCATP